MKKVFIALLAAVCCYVIVSCHKPDLPGKKRCQIKTIEDLYNPSPVTTTGAITNYAYTRGKRLLDSIRMTPVSPTGTPVNVAISYNHQGKPIGTTDNIMGSRTHKLIYESGRLTRIEMLGADNMFHPKYTFIYDSLGRIIERQQGTTSALRFEYADASRNYIRKLNMQVLRPGPFPVLEIFMKHEYTYDDKVNPMTTWPNTTVVPFYFEVVQNSNREFEPIPENNWTYQNVTANFRGSQQLAFEYFYTYQYDDVFPVKYDLRLLTYNPFIGPGPISTTTGTTRFIYDCHGSQINY
jgi:hypothetical protein